MRLSKVAIYCAAFLFLLCGIAAHGADKSLTFAWDQVITDDFAGWRLWVSDTQGGPYDKGLTYFKDAQGNPIESIWIVYDGSGAGSYTSDQVVTIPDGQAITLYFVLNAWDNADNYSTNSNEVSEVFADDIPPDGPQNFSVTVNVQ